MRIRLFAERCVTSPSFVNPMVALMKSRRMIFPVSTSPERRFSIPSRSRALRKPGSRCTRARIVSLKSRVRAIPFTFQPVFVACSLATAHVRWRCPSVDVSSFPAEQNDQPLAILAEIDPQAGAEIHSILVNACANALCVREIALLHARQCRGYFRCSLPVQAIDHAANGLRP